MPCPGVPVRYSSLGILRVHTVTYRTSTGTPEFPMSCQASRVRAGEGPARDPAAAAGRAAAMGRPTVCKQGAVLGSPQALIKQSARNGSRTPASAKAAQSQHDRAARQHPSARTPSRTFGLPTASVYLVSTCPTREARRDIPARFHTRRKVTLRRRT